MDTTIDQYITPHSYLQIHPLDNVLVALRDLPAGFSITYNGTSFLLADDVAAKHKFTTGPLSQNADIFMYGVLVGKTSKALDQQYYTCRTRLPIGREKNRVAPA
jgi:hypothetical protein